MDDFDFSDWLGDIESGLDLSGGDTSWLDNFDWGSAFDNLDFSGLDLSNVIGDVGAGGIDSLIGNFAEDAEAQGGGFYGNIFGRAEYDPRTDTTTLYDPATDTERVITHSDRAIEFPAITGFDESEFTRDITPAAEQGDVVITGPKTQEDFEDDLASDFWKNLISPKTDIGTVEIVGKRPETLLTDEEQTRQFESTTEEDLKDQFWQNLENKNEILESLLTDEEQTRQFENEDDGVGTVVVTGKKEDTTEEDLKDQFWKNLENKNQDTTSILTDEEHTRVFDEDSLVKKILNALGGSKDDSLAKILALLGGLAALSNRGGTSQPQGYQGGIPKYTATRGPARSPTEGGRRPGSAGIGSLTGGVTYTPTGGNLTIPGAAQGGLMGLAEGGKARPARYLAGGTDGMADKIQTDIDGKQPARLSHGEFVIPADVVSHLGNGNSDAGANVLYDMMAKVRKARTGNPKQGKQINPRKYIPGGGR